MTVSVKLRSIAATRDCAVTLLMCVTFAACVPVVGDECKARQDCPPERPTCRLGVCIDVDSGVEHQVEGVSGGDDVGTGDDSAGVDSAPVPGPDAVTWPDEGVDRDAGPDARGLDDGGRAADVVSPADLGTDDAALRPDGRVVVDGTARSDARESLTDGAGIDAADLDLDATPPTDGEAGLAADTRVDALILAQDAEPDAWDPSDAAWDQGRSDAGFCVASEEICDGLDNDCDDRVDEDFSALFGPCTIGVGTCAAHGVWICGPDRRSMRCDAQPGVPMPEICDNRDNDCDGEIDDGLEQSCYHGPRGTAGIGACSAGVSICERGVMSPCQGETHPADETCDGVDNDCDAQIDNLRPIEPGAARPECYDGDPNDLHWPSTGCQAGHEVCLEGGELACEAQILPLAEGADVCNGVDDDCDGEIDEDCQCEPDTPCADLEDAVLGGPSRCRVGTQVCGDGVLLACTGRVSPQPEICNGLDDDCDGELDEDADEPCYSGADGTVGVGECRAGVRRCNRLAGQLTEPCRGEIVPVDERCDGLDNDCNDEIDESFPLLGAPCAVGVGACRSHGAWFCAADERGLVCSAQSGLPGPERCDGADNDCDGEIDEQTDQSCYGGPDGTEGVGVCRAGVRVCVGVGYGECEGQVRPAGEICDGLDNDCDGQTDEGSDVPCYNGLPGTENVGICRGGIQLCVGGSLTECRDEILPEVEACGGDEGDEIDEDCDGSIDEGCQCDEGEERRCGPERGACERGLQRCEQHRWGRCDRAIQPTEEICNGRDDDCDGAIDEGFPVGGPCRVGIGQCAARGNVVCDENGETACGAEARPPRPERCDGLDNDCDGETDEDFPGLGERCAAGTGECATLGVNLCQPDGTGTQCNGEPAMPLPESCDGLDNDCDGEIDENFPDLAGECTVGLGLCLQPGIQTCAADGYDVECQVEADGLAVEPQAERCDGLDNDCDGERDEDFDLGMPCTTGSGPCRAEGVLVCDDAGEGNRCNARAGDETVEICDGLDNDCDGEIDNGFDLGEPCEVGVGICQRMGRTICDVRGGGQGVICDGVPGPASEERCGSGLDEDCNGEIDDRFPNLGEICAVGVGACRVEGVWTCNADGDGTQCPVDAGEPVAEQCDGIDNDCDGVIDNGFNLGEPCRLGVGACMTLGETVCTDNGHDVVVCGAGAVEPAVELCGNGLDDDCNGIIDEGFDVGEACIIGVGGCAREGLRICKAAGDGTHCDVSPGDPEPELCNGLDDNCNGQTDEDFALGEPCGVGTGACHRAAFPVCSADGTQTRCPAQAGEPIAERCGNEVDDDCDGEIDEGFEDLGEPCSVGVGACLVRGARVCDPGRMATVCGVEAGAPSVEACNGLDDACDGHIDNGFDLGAPCTVGEGACARPGVQICSADGTATVCDGETGAPLPERCGNGVDDDCDADIDEGFAVGERCTVGTGACRVEGTLRCNDAADGTTCAAVAGPPQAEICDGVDNDCDGTIDNGFAIGAPCTAGSGDCERPGVTVCAANGRQVVCDAIPAEGGYEICGNGTDDDCDGMADEGFDVGEPCTVGAGACAAQGHKICNARGDGTECDAAPGEPQEERCDGVDNDCNGGVDDPFNVGAPCTHGQGACMRSGVTVCAADGRDARCDAVPGDPADERCGNAIDDDCDGEIDEGYPLGVRCEVGVGACARTGEIRCSVDALSTICSVVPGDPGEERCGNAIDDDCDTEIDEGYATGEICVEGVGACRREGRVICSVDGFGTMCSVGVGEPADELCGDGIDNDCDGEIDEGFVLGRACVSGLGICARPGQTICADDLRSTPCDAVPGESAVERCGNQLDDDCDGHTDEGFVTGTACMAGTGACQRDGRIVCADDGLSVQCDANPGDPAAERCENGVDDDCDGQIDEGFRVGEACVVGTGACARDGRHICAADGLSTRCDATAGEPEIERCGNAIDDNCDGEIDEGYATGGACSVGSGGCARDGVMVCAPDELRTQCSVTAGEPGEELCGNDIDDDCDGEIDEGFSIGDACRAGVGGCAREGVTVCTANGLWTRCNAMPGQRVEERCGNGVDDDCDGQTDEGFDNGAFCAVGVGACYAEGQRVCNPDRDATTCNALAGQPIEERCGNGVDDNCNGETDEGFDVGVACEVGVGECLARGERICAPEADRTICSVVPGDPAPERCDGLDNDCNGTPDNGFELDAPCAVGIGACERSGQTICAADSLDTRCNVDPGAGSWERCGNGIDDDCDGATDEGYDDGDPCEVGLGECRAVGQRICNDARNGTECSAAPLDPQPERCDGLDNDCDGTDDNGFPLGLDCQVGVGACQRSGQQICAADQLDVQCNVAPSASGDERCGNGVDDDCDGATDEGFDVGVPCEVGVGQCRAEGRRVCNAAGNGTVCDVAAGESQPEICNGLDDDCNSAIDDGFALDAPCEVGVGACARTGVTVCRADHLDVICDASPGVSVAEICGNGIDDDCNGDVDDGFDVGEPCTVGIGECANNGNRICSPAGDGTVCSVAAGDPAPEICNGLDDNCNGGIDDGFELDAACVEGVGACVRGGVTVCRPTGEDVMCNAVAGDPVGEVCNGVDDDCNGAVDNGFALGEPCLSGVGACARSGVTVCAPDEAGVVCSAEPGQPGPEICGNGIDDDCDEATDEGFAVGEPCTVGVGECAASGVEICNEAGDGTLCDVEAGQPVPETCDNLDNDCDDTVDNGFALDEDCSAGRGVCLRFGSTICGVDGAGVICNATAAEAGWELCDNGLDDDCDGSTDEGFPDLGDPCTVGIGACVATGRWICNGAGDGTECSVRPGDPIAEICDGVDNDCDGDRDEDFDVGADCSVGVGECRAEGVKRCGPNGAGTLCDATPGEPANEICDGLDNDCDDETDEGFNAGDLCTDGGNTACWAPGVYECKADGSGTDCNAVRREAGNDGCAPTRYYGRMLDMSADERRLRMMPYRRSTNVQVTNLDTGEVIYDSGNMARYVIYDYDLPDGTLHFKVEASQPMFVAMVADCCDVGGTMYYPSYRNLLLRTGDRFLLMAPHPTDSSPFYVLAYDDVTINWASLSGQRQVLEMQAGTATELSLSADILYYFFTDSIDSTIALVSNAINGYDTVPSRRGEDVGTEFLFPTNVWRRGSGGFVVFAYDDAHVTATDLDGERIILDEAIPMGTYRTVNEIGAGLWHLLSTAEVTVWAGDFEGSSNGEFLVDHLGDDVAFTQGRRGREIWFHTQLHGATVFASEPNTEITWRDVETGAVRRERLDTDEFVDLPAQTFVYLESSQPVVVQTAGGANPNDLGTILRAVPPGGTPVE